MYLQKFCGYICILCVSDILNLADKCHMYPQKCASKGTYVGDTYVSAKEPYESAKEPHRRRDTLKQADVKTLT